MKAMEYIFEKMGTDVSINIDAWDTYNIIKMLQKEGLNITAELLSRCHPNIISFACDNSFYIGQIFVKDFKYEEELDCYEIQITRHQPSTVNRAIIFNPRKIIWEFLKHFKEKIQNVMEQE